MELTSRLTDQVRRHLEARSKAPLKATSLPAMDAADAGHQSVEVGFYNDLGNILEDLGRHGLAGLFGLWCERRHYRRELKRLFVVGPYIISDVGLTMDQARSDMDRPFWAR